MTRLIDLNPKWVLPPAWSQQSEPLHIGVSFDCICAKCLAAACPTCGHKPARQRLAVLFWPPIDAHGLMARYGLDAEQLRASWCSQAHHRVGGETLDSLTLAPSIGFEAIGHWHGHISNGEVTTS